MGISGLTSGIVGGDASTGELLPPTEGVSKRSAEFRKGRGVKKVKYYRSTAIAGSSKSQKNMHLKPYGFDTIICHGLAVSVHDEFDDLSDEI
jgi:hypothetical protein